MSETTIQAERFKPSHEPCARILHVIRQGYTPYVVKNFSRRPEKDKNGNLIYTGEEFVGWSYWLFAPGASIHLPLNLAIFRTVAHPTREGMYEAAHSTMRELGILAS